MSEITTKKAIIILRYMTKTELSNVLLISRKTLYSRLKDNKWNDYHVEVVDYIFNKLDPEKELIKIVLEDKKICMYFVERIKPIKIIYPNPDL